MFNNTQNQNKISNVVKNGNNTLVSTNSGNYNIHASQKKLMEENPNLNRRNVTPLRDPKGNVEAVRIGNHYYPANEVTKRNNNEEESEGLNEVASTNNITEEASYLLKMSANNLKLAKESISNSNEPLSEEEKNEAIAVVEEANKILNSNIRNLINKQAIENNNNLESKINALKKKKLVLNEIKKSFVINRNNNQQMASNVENTKIKNKYSMNYNKQVNELQK